MHSRARQTLAVLQEFLATPLATRLDRHRHTAAAEHALALFRSAAKEVPAYRAFLFAQDIDPARIRTPADFERLPLMNVQN